MSKKLLMYIDKSFFHFGIAKSIQEKYDYEISVVYDLNHVQKKYFQEQNIVNFKKAYYLQDEVSNFNNKPDLEYLKNFEDTYKINIWTLAYSERLFYQFNKYYKFMDNEILSIIEKECKFLEKVFEQTKPDFLLIRTTDWHRNHLMTEMCKSKGIKVMMLNVFRFRNRVLLSSEYDKFDSFGDKISKKRRTIDELENYLGKYNAYPSIKKYSTRRSKISFLSMLKIVLKVFLILGNVEYGKFYENFGRTPFRFLIKEGLLLLKGKYRKLFIDKNFIHTIDGGSKFIYFTLHVEPERTASIDAPFYMDQISIITNIAKALPVGYRLYVKEHPSMRYRSWRSISYYKEILSLPNVRLIHPDIPPEELLKKCSLVITIAGSVGIEAALYKKPVIVFADVSYSQMPWVFRLRNIEDLPKIIRSALTKEINPLDLNLYVDLVDDNTFEFDIAGLYNDIFTRFFYNTLFGDNDISSSEMDSFLTDHKKEFDLLADKHITKMLSHKSQ